MTRRSGLRIALSVLTAFSCLTCPSGEKNTCALGIGDADCQHDGGDSSLMQLHKLGKQKASLASGSSGRLTMWSDSPTTIVGGSCEYANSAQGGLSSPAATSPYIAKKAYCAADNGIYNGGAGCGNCYKVVYSGTGGTDGGSGGELVVQIVDSGSAKTFDCQLTAFTAITGGANTGVYPITYKQVDCATGGSSPVATVLDGGNAWFVKMIFSNLAMAVIGAQITIGGNPVPMSRNSVSATWVASTSKGTQGKGVVVTFTLTLADGSEVTLDPCFTGWPQSTNAHCSPGDLRAPVPDPTPAPTPDSTPAPTPVPTPAPTPCSGMAGKWQQCAGGKMSSQLCCPTGWECAGHSTHMQCMPKPCGPNEQCSCVWETCGGEYWKGPTCCVEGSHCVYHNKWHSQCLHD